MNDRDIEDTREPEFEEVDPDEMWKRIDDALDKFDSNLLHDLVDGMDKKITRLVREKLELRRELEALKANHTKVIDAINDEMGEWAGIETPYLPRREQALQDILEILDPQETK